MHRKQFLKLMGAGAATLAGGSLLSACGSASTDRSNDQTKNWAWMTGDLEEGDTWRPHFEQMHEAGIDAVLLQQEDPEILVNEVLPVANDVGLGVHVWVKTMMRSENVEAHPDWYAVNREGVSTAEDPPYVDYYHFMSPCVPAVRDYLANHVDALAQLDGVEGVHLDYIRFPDVILPITLQPKYDLNQDKEYPEFDYGYHPECRALFEKQTGTDPMDLEDPPSNEAWVQFRYNQITQVVGRLAKVAHGHGKMITAAVFPTPDIARRLVRQNWPEWNLDAVMPMIYHNFYDKKVPWIETATQQGVQALNGTFPLYSGLFIPELTPEQLTRAVEHARAGGAKGVTLFRVREMTDAHWQHLTEALAA